PGVLHRHVVLPHMRAVGAGGERDVDAVVDQQRDVERRELRLDRPRARDHAPRVAVLVPQLHQRRAAECDQPREDREIAAARAFGIDEGIEAKVNAHQGIDDSMSCRDMLDPPAALAWRSRICWIAACGPAPRGRREWSPSSSRSNANSANPTKWRTSSRMPSSLPRSIRPPATSTCW